MDSFVIDTNIIFSSLLRDSTARKIILSDAFNLFAPEFLFTEIKKYAPFIALALKLDIPIWSNDLDFKKQTKVISYTTDEIMTDILNFQFS